MHSIKFARFFRTLSCTLFFNLRDHNSKKKFLNSQVSTGRVRFATSLSYTLISACRMPNFETLKIVIRSAQ